MLNHFVTQHGENVQLQALQRDYKLRTDAQTRINYPLRDDREKEFEAPVEVDAVEGEEDAERRGTAGDLAWVQDQVRRLPPLLPCSELETPFAPLPQVNADTGQVIKYLCAEYNVTSRQTEEGVATLADSLQDHGLTKGEVLQIVNLAPIEMVELYCVRPPLSLSLALLPVAR